MRLGVSAQNAKAVIVYLATFLFQVQLPFYKRKGVLRPRLPPVTLFERFAGFLGTQGGDMLSAMEAAERVDAASAGVRPRLLDGRRRRRCFLLTGVEWRPRNIGP
mgnify:CR=1 FL=1